MKRSVALLAVFALLIFAYIPLYASEPLPNGYGGIELGMTIDEVKEILKKNPQFGYRGERDVSLLPGENRVLIETDSSLASPYSFLTQCWFQFYDGKLYIITINLNQTKMDHYSVFSTLCSKYGNPGALNPSKSEWKNDSVLMVLERPLTLKYTDRKVFDQLQQQALARESAAELTREQFLEGL